MITAISRDMLTPAQEAALRRWCTAERLSPISPMVWAWLLSDSHELENFLRWDDERLAAFAADYDEAPDAEAEPRRLAWWRRWRP